MGDLDVLGEKAKWEKGKFSSPARTAPGNPFGSSLADVMTDEPAPCDDRRFHKAARVLDGSLLD